MELQSCEEVIIYIHAFLTATSSGSLSLNPVRAGASALSSLMSLDLCTDLNYDTSHSVLALCVSVCVFVSVWRLPGSLQVSVSIIQRAERSEPVEATSAVFSFSCSVCPLILDVLLCSRIWQSGVSHQSFL